MSKKIKFSILVPTKDRSKSLKLLFESLKKQSYKNFEVVLGDGGSKDGTFQLVKDYNKYFPVKIIPAAEGLVAATNAALSGASGEIIIRIDDDIETCKNWLAYLKETFDSDTEIGGVTGPTIIPQEYLQTRDLFIIENALKNGNFLMRLLGKFYFGYILEGQPYALGKLFRTGAFSLGSNFENVVKRAKHSFECDYLEGCNTALRKDLVMKVGGFDSAFIGVGDYNEMDVVFKIKKLGYKMFYNPKAIVFHKPSKEGVFKARPVSYGRMLNYLTFYFRHIKPDNIDKICRFFSYIILLNSFWFYKFLKSGDTLLLGSIPATIVGCTGGIKLILLYKFRMKHL